jgi:hypothetical protein
VDGLKHQKEKRSMDHFAGLDVSVKETSVCIVDDTGKIVREVKVASEPEALLAVLKNPAYHFKRIGLEAGPLSQWLFSALAEAELPVVCVETRQMRAVLKAQINKTDRNDARGIAQMMRVGLYRPVHVKGTPTAMGAAASGTTCRPPPSGRLLPIGLVFSTWPATCGSGFRIATMKTTTVRPQTVHCGPVEIAVVVSSVAAPGTALVNSSAPPTATGSTPATGTMGLASVSAERLPFETAKP